MKDTILMIGAGVGNIVLFLTKFNVVLSTVAAVLTISYAIWKWYRELYPKKRKTGNSNKD